MDILKKKGIIPNENFLKENVFSILYTYIKFNQQIECEQINKLYYLS